MEELFALVAHLLTTLITLRDPEAFVRWRRSRWR